MELLVELPRLRPGAAPVRLAVEGIGVESLSSRRHERPGVETRWTLRIRASGAAGRRPIVLRAAFPDGRSVEVREVLTVVPARPAERVPWALGSAVALGVIVLVAAMLALARRRSSSPRRGA